MTRSTLCLALLAAATVGCASGPPAAPGPEGRRAINSPSTLAMLEEETRKRADTEYDDAAREARAALFEAPRKLNRARDPDAHATLPGGNTVDRTVSVRFGFGSTRFMPTPEQSFRMRELFALAERISVFGRTDGIGPREGDEMVARMRAEAAKRYLVGRGVPARIISVSYIAGGDPVADNGRRDGRRENRRVDIEFILPDSMTPDADDVAAWQPVIGS